MRFRRTITFNTQDSKVNVGERIVVSLGVRKRCETALFGYLSNKGGLTVLELTEFVNNKNNCLYSNTDMKTATRKLVAAGLVEMVEGRFVATKGAKTAWQKMPKDFI